MEWLLEFFDEAFNEHGLIYVDVFTFCGYNSHGIEEGRAYITLENGAEEILQCANELGLSFEYYLHCFRIKNFQ